MKKRAAAGRMASAKRTATKDPLEKLDRHLRALLGRADAPVIDKAGMTHLNETRVVLQKRRDEDPAVFTRMVRRQAGLGATVERLFPWVRPRRDLPTLQDFFLVRWPGLDPRALNVNPYDLAYALQEATRSVSASPDPLVALGPTASAVREPDSVPDPSVMLRSTPPDNAGWHLFAANVPPAWGLTSGLGAGIVVGHVDTGIVPHVLLGGRVNLSGGFDFLRPGSPPIDPLPAAGTRADVPGHGTFSSTVIAGSLDPGVPVATGAAQARPTTTFSGVAPGVTILPTRVTRSVVVGPLSYVAQAIQFLTAGGAHVISISLGGPSISPFLHYSLNNAVLNDVIVVAAAGQGTPVVVMPAALRNCIAVAGTKLNDTTGLSNDFTVMRDRLTLWGPSAFGPKVGIAAPAKDIRHGAPGSVDGSGMHTAIGGLSQGTTFATAMVAGVAALWLDKQMRPTLVSRYRNLRSLQSVFKEILAGSAFVPGGWHRRWGPGALDAAAALNELLPPGNPGPPPAFLAYRNRFDRHDVLEWFEDAFPDLSPDALRAALRRLLPASSAAEWRNALERFGAELLTRLGEDADAAAGFIETGVAEAAADAAAAADQARQTAEALVDQASDRLRGALGL
ncbi:MAG TPA: S8 family serine peptidase [Methylomirabilota bacterium]|nr:S8 family serine peptidase [Methylomirabilota bacterium]